MEGGKTLMEDRRNAASAANSVVTFTSCYVICLISNSKNLRETSLTQERRKRVYYC